MDLNVSNNSDKTKLENYFIKKIKDGNILTNYELKKYAKKRNLKLDKSTISSLRNDVLATALYQKPFKIKVFQTVTHDRLGLLSIDFAYYKKNWSSSNNGYVGFLMVNSVIANKWHAIPMKSRKTSDFENALEEVCMTNAFPAVSTILSDRETTLFSHFFQKKMRDKYQIKFRFIHRYNKSWAAELAIRHVKTDLSIALQSTGGKNWIDLLPEVVNNHNRKKIEGTTFSPNDVDDRNFFDFINQLHNEEDATMNFATNSIDSRSILNKKWIRKIFKFKINQKVIASKYSLEGRKAFDKTSVEGTYSSTPFYIKSAKLRQTRKKTLVPGTYIYIYTYIQQLLTDNFFFLQFIN